MSTFRFRPSSHSEDYTIIGTFKTQKQAAKACEALEKLVEEVGEENCKLDIDWSPEDTRVSNDGTKVIFEVYTAGYMSPIEAVMRKNHVERMEYFDDLQYLTITVALPPRITPNLIALILDRDDACAVKYLNANCGEAEKITCDGVDWLVWHYRGDGIYNKDEDLLYLGQTEISLEEKPQWTVEEE